MRMSFWGNFNQQIARQRVLVSILTFIIGQTTYGGYVPAPRRTLRSQEKITHYKRIIMKGPGGQIQIDSGVCL